MTNKQEQQYFSNGHVCLFIYHTAAIKFPRSSSYSYKLPKKIVAEFSHQKVPKL